MPFLNPAGAFNAGSTGAMLILADETDGLAADFTWGDGRGVVAIKDTGTPANNKTNVSADAFFTNAGTSPKLIVRNDGVLVWSPHNLFLNSATPATQNVTLVVGQNYTVTVTGSGSVSGSAGASGTAISGTPATFTATTVTGTFTVTGTPTTMQINRGTVATDYLATTGSIRIGMSIDYHDSKYQLLVENEATNLALYASDFTNAAWTKTNMSSSLTSEGPNGVANSATRLTAIAGNATALQAIVSASATRVSSVWLKRVTGTGNIDITQDNGSIWTTVTITSSWAKYEIPFVIQTNATVGIRIVTVGDAVDLALFQHETGSTVATSSIPTFSATVLRTQDSISKATTTLPYSATNGTFVAIYTSREAKNTVTAGILGSDDGTANERVQLRLGSADGVDDGGNLLVTDGGVSQADLATAVDLGAYPQKLAGVYKVNDFVFIRDGTGVENVTMADATGTLPTVTTFRLGMLHTANFTARGWISKILYLPRRMTNADIVALSPPTGAWTWFTEPRAIRYVGVHDRTYYGVVNTAGDVGIAAYDHDLEKNLPKFNLHSALQQDDHCNAVLLARSSDRKILAFYCQHLGTTMYMRISTNSEDITAFDGEQDLDAQIGDGDYTYPNPIQLEDEVNDPIYLFYRGFNTGANTYSLYYSKSTDQGATWATRTEVYRGPNFTGSNSMYFKVTKNGNSRIDFFVTNGHPDDTNTSIFHFYYTGGLYYKVDGTQIVASPITSGDLSGIARVYDGSTTAGWIWDAAIDSSGRPVCAYANFPSTSDHRYRSARWNGASWTDAEISDGGGFLFAGQPHYSGGVSLDKIGDISSVYTSRIVNGRREIWRYTTSNSGASWGSGTGIVLGSAATVIRPYAPVNAHQRLRFVYCAGTYVDYTNFNMSINSYPASVLSPL